MYDLKKFLAWQLYVHYIMIATGLFILTLIFSPNTLLLNSFFGNILGFVILTVALFFIDTFVHVFLNATTGWDD